MKTCSRQDYSSISGHKVRNEDLAVNETKLKEETG